MRKLLAVALMTLPVAGFAASGSQTLVNEAALPYNNTYQINLNQYGTPQSAASKIAVQITYASSTVANATFTDGQASTMSITVVTNDLLARSSTDTITVPATARILAQGATAQITVSSGVPNSTIFVNGNALIEGVNWFATTTTTGTAGNIAGAINTYIGALVSTNAGRVVYATTTIAGVGGNSFTITTSSPPAYSTTSFSGGRNGDLLNQSISFNGIKAYNGIEWTDASGTSSGTAASIAAWLTRYSVVTATSSGSVVYATATVAGLAGNSFTLTSSTNNLTIGFAAFVNGQDNASVSVNGRTYTAGVNFSTGTTAQTATNLATAVNATSATFNVVAAAASNVVYGTSTVVGTASNYALTSSTQNALKLSVPVVVTGPSATGVMTGGLNTAFARNSALITIPSTTLTRGMQVLYTTGTIAINPLSNQTTYYVIPVDANTISLALTSTGAVAGLPIVITSSATSTTGHTYTLAPLPFIQGSAAAKWEVSNDGVNWQQYLVTSANVAVPTNTFAAVNPSTTTIQDFGFVDYGFLRYNVTAPSQGGVNLKVILNSKD